MAGPQQTEPQEDKELRGREVAGVAGQLAETNNDENRDKDKDEKAPIAPPQHPYTEQSAEAKKRDDEALAAANNGEKSEKADALEAARQQALAMGFSPHVANEAAEINVQNQVIAAATEAAKNIPPENLMHFPPPDFRQAPQPKTGERERP